MNHGGQAGLFDDERGATFSDDEVYRYALWRRWDRTLGFVAFIGLNPSTADATKDDPTIRRCLRFARDWGYGGIEMLNLFALRATDPRALRRADDPVGPKNDRILRSTVALCSLVVCAWGAHGEYKGRDREVMGPVLGGTRLYHLGLTNGGHPKHPLYLRADTRPTSFHEGRAK